MSRRGWSSGSRDNTRCSRKREGARRRRYWNLPSARGADDRDIRYSFKPVLPDVARVCAEPELRPTGRADAQLAPAPARPLPPPTRPRRVPADPGASPRPRGGPRSAIRTAFGLSPAAPRRGSRPRPPPHPPPARALRPCSPQPSPRLAPAEPPPTPDQLADVLRLAGAPLRLAAR